MKTPHDRLWVRHVDGPLGIKSDFDADFELSKKISSLIFRAQKMVKGRTYIIAGFQMLQFFLGMRVFCLKYPFSHKKWFSGKKAPNPRDLPILKWTMGRVKAVAGSWVWTAAVGWRGGSLTRKRPVKIALRYIEVGRRTSVFFLKKWFISALMFGICVSFQFQFCFHPVFGVYILNEMLNCWFWEGDVVRKCRIPERAFIEGG